MTATLSLKRSLAPRRRGKSAEGLWRCLAAMAACTLATTATGAPVNAVFTIDSNLSSMTVEATASIFSDADTQRLDGALNATLDFGGAGFGQNGELTVTSGTIAAQGDYRLTLGIPPYAGVEVTAAGLSADVSTPIPPGFMSRSAAVGVAYEFDASQYLITVNQGTVVITGSSNDSLDLAAAPVSGASPLGTLGNVSFTPTGAVEGPYTQVDAELTLPVHISAPVAFAGGSFTAVVDMTATIVARSTFFVALDGVAGDFDDDGRVDAADLVIWAGGFGLASGASVNSGDADDDGDVDGGDFLIWQQNVGLAPPAVALARATAVPEPLTASMLALAAIAFTAVVRRGSCELAG